MGRDKKWFNATCFSLIWCLFGVSSQIPADTAGAQSSSNQNIDIVDVVQNKGKMLDSTPHSNE